MRRYTTNEIEDAVCRIGESCMSYLEANFKGDKNIFYTDEKIIGVTSNKEEPKMGDFPIINYLMANYLKKDGDWEVIIGNEIKQARKLTMKSKTIYTIEQEPFIRRMIGDGFIPEKHIINADNIGKPIGLRALDEFETNTIRILNEYPKTNIYITSTKKKTFTVEVGIWVGLNDETRKHLYNGITRLQNSLRDSLANGLIINFPPETEGIRMSPSNAVSEMHSLFGVSKEQWSIMHKVDNSISDDPMNGLSKRCLKL